MRNASFACLIALGAAVTLASCDQPKDRRPADAAPAAPPPAPAPLTPLPALPAWSGEFVGKAVKDLFPGELKPCVGNNDKVEQRHADGVRIVGWGWDLDAKSPIDRVILVDVAGVVVGAGETGVPRPDVIAAKPEITSPTTGWAALTHRTVGPVNAYGLVGGGKSLCQLGRLEF